MQVRQLQSCKAGLGRFGRAPRSVLVQLNALCLWWTAGRGWTHGGRCLYEPAPAMSGR